jgi:GTPase involved in cell partitioning and DNA repair
MSSRPSMIVANKMDGEASAENLERLKKDSVGGRYPIVPVTAALGELGELKKQLRAIINESRAAAEAEKAAAAEAAAESCVAEEAE